MAGGCHLFDKWTPGTLTNGQQILRRTKKKVVDELDREQPGFEPQLKYSAAVKPDLVVCLNPLENYVLLHECGIHNIPTVGIIDTDANPTWVTYPIPANDDSLRCVQVLAGALGRAGEEGQRQRLASAKEGYITYEPRHHLEMPTKDEVEASKRGEAGEKSRHDEIEEEFDDEIEVVEAESEPDAYALRMEKEEKERELQARESGGRDEKLANLAELDEELEDEDAAQFSQPDFDLVSDRARRGETTPGGAEKK